MQKFIITYGFHTTPFGDCILALSNHGICHLSFTDNHQQSLADLKSTRPNAQFMCNQTITQPIIDAIFSSSEKSYTPNFDLQGTPFQVKVWQALLKLPFGTTISYSQLAHNLGMPQATRAIARAVASNQIAVLIPCHRVIAKNGNVHNYRWGTERKKALLLWEAHN